MSFKLLEKLNDKQREAAAQVDGSILILAGAGSGKTRTITYRIANMIENVGINPYSILAVTFTNKAAKEMRERVESLIGEEAKKCTISTFHSFGVKLLRMYAKELGYDSNFTIYDGDDQKRIVKTILKEYGLEKINDREIASLISKIKEEDLSVKEYEYINKNFAEIYEKYNRNLKSNNAMDFSDILVNTYNLLKLPHILERIQDKYKYVMIDEYQDTNNLQYKIIDLIAKKNLNLCVVGDENQSIYGFRGANISNILNFEKNYSNSKIIKLEENYRSTSVILEAANEVIKNNKSSKDKKLWTQNENGELIQILECDNGRDEVNKIIDIIREEHSKGVPYKDITILYRTNAQSRIFEEGFLRYNIPHKVFGGISFYARAEIKDIVAYLSVIANPKDELNLTRILNVPKRKLGDKGLEKIVEFARENKLSLLESLNYINDIAGLNSVTKEKLMELYNIIKDYQEMVSYETTSEIVNGLIEKIGYLDYVQENYDNYETRLENIDEFKNSILELENIVGDLRLNEYLENISLVSATDDLEESNDYVKLMTIHNSKGLEFPIVFIVGFENEIFPGNKALNDDNELEEERRLCYVAITRAEKKLYLSYSHLRFIYGVDKLMTKSIFLKEIPTKLYEEKFNKTQGFNVSSLYSEKYTEKEEKFSFKKKIEINSKNMIPSSTSKSEIISKLGFKVGDRVKHKKFGLGVVREITDKKMVVQFVDGNKDIANIIADKFLTKVD
ncbi:MAG: UvrD-helicase domain-containing protein [Fusobacterium gastrosuis]|uniref:ATP-dependent helicase n=1 Tax=Fusobacterium gastrosuis TaxID=1755100 RepID=UPI002A856C52|nr:UvrD-helicase domain-containing protein [Fusobacterium gastrosuis]MDY5794824.1 UvrD-helicase domain-containing protein [Fusobacterium gastrosuis]